MRPFFKINPTCFDILLSNPVTFRHVYVWFFGPLHASEPDLIHLRGSSIQRGEILSVFVCMKQGMILQKLPSGCENHTPHTHTHTAAVGRQVCHQGQTDVLRHSKRLTDSWEKAITHTQPQTQFKWLWRNVLLMVTEPLILNTLFLIFYKNGESANDTFKYVHTVWMCLMALLAVFEDCICT